MTNETMLVLVDTLLGLLAREMEIPPERWTSECLARSSRAWHHVALLEDADEVGTMSSAFSGEIWETLAVGRSVFDMVSNIDEIAAGHMPFPAWGCPYCVDDDGDPVRLDYLGHGEWVCPSCCSHTVSPADDACVRLDADEVGLGGEMS